LSGRGRPTEDASPFSVYFAGCLESPDDTLKVTLKNLSSVTKLRLVGGYSYFILTPVNLLVTFELRPKRKSEEVLLGQTHKKRGNLSSVAPSATASETNPPRPSAAAKSAEADTLGEEAEDDGLDRYCGGAHYLLQSSQVLE
jgi:hypothetical protein